MKNLFTQKQFGEYLPGTRPGVLCTILSLVMAFVSISVFAQAPNISYSSPQVFYTNMAISPVTPTNSGGAVAALTTTTFASAITVKGIAVDSAGNVYASTGSMVK